MKENIKMRVTQEQSKKVQEIVFANGGRWITTGQLLYEQDYNCIYIDENKVMFDVEYNDFECEEVDADLFIRTNGTCEEEPHAELKLKYESGDYIQVYRTICEDSDITEWILPKANIGKFVYKYNGRKYEYKLIHKLHEEVLEHWLGGGEVEFEVSHNSWEKLHMCFIDSYNEEVNYRIKQNQPQTRKFATKKELVEALMRGEKWSPSIKYITFNHQFAEYNERIDGNPFRYGDNSSGFSALTFHWHYCDGKTLWTRVND